jgi:hypothetical protein
MYKLVVAWVYLRQKEARGLDTSVNRGTSYQREELSENVDVDNDNDVDEPLLRNSSSERGTAILSSTNVACNTLDNNSFELSRIPPLARIMMVFRTALTLAP